MGSQYCHRLSRGQALLLRCRLDRIPRARVRGVGLLEVNIDEAVVQVHEHQLLTRHGS